LISFLFFLSSSCFASASRWIFFFSLLTSSFSLAFSFFSSNFLRRFSSFIASFCWRTFSSSANLVARFSAAILFFSALILSIRFFNCAGPCFRQ